MWITGRGSSPKLAVTVNFLEFRVIVFGNVSFFERSLSNFYEFYRKIPSHISDFGFIPKQNGLREAHLNTQLRSNFFDMTNFRFRKSQNIDFF